MQLSKLLLPKLMLHFVHFSQIGVVDEHMGRPVCALGIGGCSARGVLGLVLLNCVVEICKCMILSLGLTSNWF